MKNAFLSGPVELIFIRAGRTKKNLPYLQVSNGRAELWVNCPKDLNPEVFEAYKENDPITLQVEVLVGSDTVKLIRVGE